MATTQIQNKFINGLQKIGNTVSPVYGSLINTIVAGNDNRLSTSNVLLVKKNPGAGEFSSVADALASFSDESINNPYVIKVSPGVFEVSSTIILRPHVSITGEGKESVLRMTGISTLIQAIGTTTIQKIRLDGSSQVGTSSIKIEGSVSVGALSASDIYFGDSYCLVDMDSTGGACAAIFSNSRVILGTCFHAAFHCHGSGTGVLGIQSFAGILNKSSSVCDHFIQSSGGGNRVFVGGINLNVSLGTTLSKVIHVDDGAYLGGDSFFISGAGTALFVPNVGASPSINISGLSSIGNAQDISILHPGTNGYISGTLSRDKISVISAAAENIAITYSDISSTGSRGFSLLGDIRQGGDLDRLVNISKLLRTSSTLGLISGGALSKTAVAFEVLVSEGTGFVRDGLGIIQEVSWGNTIVTFTPSTEEFITVNAMGVVGKEPSTPQDFSTRIVLGRINTSSVGIAVIVDSAYNANQHGNQLERYLRQAIGSRYVSGSFVSENAITNRAIDISSGRYYFGTRLFQPAGGVGISFLRLSRDSLGVFTATPSSVVDNTEYDNGSGTLQAIPLGHYVKHTLIGAGDGVHEQYALITAQQTHALLVDAVNEPLPILPPGMGEGRITIASIIVQEGNANFVGTPIDLRPRFDFAAASQTSITSHSDLSGLALGNDHPQYLLRSGSNAMTGPLDLGGQDIINAGSIPGTTTAAPVSQTPDQANTEGISVHKARADHVHNIPTASAITLSASTNNTVGIANSFARSNHTHSILTGNVSAQSAGGVNSAGISENLSRADHQHSFPVAAPVSIGTSNAEGNATSFSRSNHVHAHGSQGGGAEHLSATNILAGFMSALDKAKLDGVAAGATLNSTDAYLLARANHTGEQAISTVTGLQNALNSKTDLTVFNLHASRHLPSGADPLTTAPAVSLSASTTDTEGNAESFSRSNHTHNILTGNVSTQNTGQINTEGVSANLARADHLHQIPTAVPVTIGTVNSEGNATSFSRSNHVHSHGDQAGGLLHSIVTRVINGFMSALDKVKIDQFNVGDLIYSNAALVSTSSTTFIDIPLDFDRDSFPNALLTKVNVTEFRTEYSGKVRISYNAWAFANANDRGWEFVVTRNNIPVNSTYSRGVGKNTPDRSMTCSISLPVNCSPGDVFKLQIRSIEGAVITINENAATMALEISRINL